MLNINRIINSKFVEMEVFMKKTILEKNNKLPYSLHDMKIKRIEIDNDDIVLIFENGYVELKKPYKQVDGKILIKDVDYDFSCIYLLSENGNYGNFSGRKLEISDFISEFREYSLEVVDELYGFNQLEYSGYITLANSQNLIQFSMSFYYTGDLIYITEENVGCLNIND